MMSFNCVSMAVLFGGLAARNPPAATAAAAAADADADAGTRDGGGGGGPSSTSAWASAYCLVLAFCFGSFATALFRYRHDIIRDEAALRSEHAHRMDLAARIESVLVSGEDEGRPRPHKALFYSDDGSG
jgi:hypothetical protein